MDTTRPIQLPSDQADRIEAAAKAMGLTVSAYLQYLETRAARGHDAKFNDALKYVFSKYPQTLKKLAQ